MTGVIIRTVRVDKDTEGRPCDDKGRSQGERPQNETNLANILINLQNCEKMLFFFKLFKTPVCGTLLWDN